MTRTVRITPADQAQDPYYYVPFAVPEGTTRIDVAMRYPKAEDCVIDLGCVDPAISPFPSPGGFRGWSGGAREGFFIATDDATPGYVHGPIAAGEWQVVLGLYKVPAQGVEIVLDIAFDRAARPTLPQPVRTDPVRPGAGWYKGDLHCHTYHSDARGAPEVLHAAALQAGLDFLAVADHNTTTQRRYFHPASSPELVFVRAMEVTTANGHANVFGVDAWIDFRMRRPKDADALATNVHARGGLLSINHDKPPIPWDYVLPDCDLMEVWQSSWLAWNWVSLERYQRRLAAGMRLSAIGGSDYHQPETLRPEGPLVLARPTTVLWLDALSEDAILAAMKAGRGYVTEAPDGPHLALRVNGVLMGGAVALPPGDGELEAEIVVERAGGDILALIDASGVIARLPIASEAETIRFACRPETFLRCEIVAQASRQRLFEGFVQAVGPGPLPGGLTVEMIEKEPIRRALTNPVYMDQGDR